MTLYKLTTFIKRDFLQRKKRMGKDARTYKQKFSFKYLNQLLKTYKVNEYLWIFYENFGEDKASWYDENSCWIKEAFLNKNNFEINRVIYKELKYTLKHQKVNIYKRNIFILETNNLLIVYIPLRDISNKDISISFVKQENLD